MKILMISDYNVPIGGIEQYICDATQLLSTDGHDVSIVGLSLSPRLLHRVRSFLLPITVLNRYIALKIVYQIIVVKPDLIRRNSVSRYVGWFPIWVVGLFHIRTWMMYHDLGYFHPYPRLLTDISQIPSQWALSSWLAAGTAVGKSSLLQRIMMSLKFRSMSVIRWSLMRTASIHLVPSPYIVPILESRGIQTKKIQILGHFGRVENYFASRIEQHLK